LPISRKGVLALSIMMTTVSTLVAVVTVPFLLSFYSGLAGVTGDYVIPAGNVAQVLVVLLVPTVLGMVLRKMNANIGATIELVGSLLGVSVILFLIVLGAAQLPDAARHPLAGLHRGHRHRPDGHAAGLLAGARTASGPQPRPHHQPRNRHPERAAGSTGRDAVLHRHTAAGGAVHPDPLQPLHRADLVGFITIWYRRSATAEALARDAAKVAMRWSFRWSSCPPFWASPC
jgi:hypothetical protein